MRVILLEIKKAVTLPIIIVLFLLFTAYNLFFLYSNSGHREELTIVNDIIDAYGLQITDAALHQFELDLQREYATLNEITVERVGRTYESAEQLYSEMPSMFDQFNEEEHHLFEQLFIKESYYQFAKEIDDHYASIDIEEFAISTVNTLKLSGKVEQILLERYAQFAEKYEAMIENEEHKQWFFHGQIYKMHTLLHNTVIQQLVFQLLIMTVLLTAFMTNYEFDQRTQLVSYTTKCGRSLQMKKLIAANIVTLSSTICLILITLGAYFMIFDYSRVWGSSINSAFNWEGRIPFIAWQSFTVAQFLTMIISIIIISMLIISSFTFVLTTWLRNSYFPFILFAILYGTAFVVPTFSAKDSVMIFGSYFTLPVLLYKPGFMFEAVSRLYGFSYYELATVTGSFLIVVLLINLTKRYFYKKEIH